MDHILNNLQLQLANYISKYYKLDNMQYQLLVNSMTYFTSKYNNITTNDLNLPVLYNYINYTPMIILISIILLSYLSYRYYTYIYNDYTVISIIQNVAVIDIINTYMSLNPDVFKTDNVSYILDNKYLNNYKIYTDKIYFNDHVMKQSGYIVYTKCATMQKDTFIYSVDISLYISKKNTKNYLKQMETYVLDHKKNTDMINITFTKLLKTCISSTSIYNGTLVDFNNENNELYKSYFSKNKYLIDNFINNINPYNNIILYGPSGVGKSKIIYLCARMAKCNLLSIDLSLYINKKTELFLIFNGGGVDYTNPQTHTRNFNPKYSYTGFSNSKIIIVLEEIDYAIDLIINNTLEIQNKENKKSILTEKEDTLHLSDLLELFQSIIPMNNRYIFATTNNIDKIKNIIPALFRPGRMTPIYHTYMEWNDLNDICKYYYNEELTLCPVNIKIPTSQIIEDIKLYKLSNKSFTEFETHLSKILSN